MPLWRQGGPRIYILQEQDVNAVKVKVILQPTVSLSWCQASIWDTRPIFLLPFFIQFRVCCCSVLSLTTGRICSLQLLLGLASAVFLGSESSGNRDHILLYQFWYSPSWRAGFLYLFPPRKREAQLYPQVHWLSVVVYITTDCQSASLSWCRALLRGPWPDYSFSLLRSGNSLILEGSALSDERTDL
jgi:hypothetical protein